jgi:hypothetical protein
MPLIQGRTVLCNLQQLISQQNSTYPEAVYPERQLYGSVRSFNKFVENSTKLTCLEITGYLIKYIRVLSLLELHIRHGRNVWTTVHTVNSNSRNSNCQCSLFAKKNSIIRISSYPDGSLYQLIRIIGDLLYTELTLRAITEGDTIAINKERYRHFKVSARALSDRQKEIKSTMWKVELPTSIKTEDGWMVFTLLFKMILSAWGCEKCKPYVKRMQSRLHRLQRTELFDREGMKLTYVFM